MKVRRLAEKFFVHASRTNTPKSLQGLKDRLRLFLDEFGETKTTKVSRERLIRFLHDSQGTLSGNTHRQNFSRIRALQNYALRFDHLERPWLRKGDYQAPPATFRETLPTLEQTAQILSVMRADAQPIYRCLRLTGARPGELCNATIDQLTGEPGETVIVQEKHKTARKTGLKRRILVIPAAEQIVQEAIGGRTEGPIFLTVSGKPWRVDLLSREFRRCREKLGIDRRIVLYTTRHAAASLMIDAGAEITDVKVQLGHTDIGTTQRYIHPDERKVRKSVAVIPDVKPKSEDAV